MPSNRSKCLANEKKKFDVVVMKKMSVSRTEYAFTDRSPNESTELLILLMYLKLFFTTI
jgi:hypothetical protein